MKIEEHVPLSTLTTFKTGGPARFVVTATDQEVAEAYAFARTKGLPVVPLGGGSNVLAPDTGLSAVVLRIAASPLVTDEREHDATITVGAGVVWDTLVAHAALKGWWGIENLSAIPGTVGGAVVQNIGAYGAVLSDTLVSVETYDSHKGVAKTFSNAECLFGYRTSVFKEEQDRYFILHATLKLSKVGVPNIEYKDLRTHFGAATPTLLEVRGAVIEARAKKFPSLTEFGTAGSFFLNQVMDETAARAVQERYPEMPLFIMPEGGVKVPLGWFLDHVLKLRGVKEGSVEAWRDQALVIAAHQGATTKEVLAFAEKISKRVEEVLKIKISPEVRVLQVS